MAKKTIEQIDASLARWQSRLKRAVNAIDRLLKQRKRIAKAKPEVDLAIAPPLAKAVVKPEIDTGIPAFLQRPVRSAADAAAADQIRQEQADAKRAKTAARASRKAANKSGATRRMPLTGKAALAAIRNA